MENEEKLKKLYRECLQELSSIGITFEKEKIEIYLSKRNNKRYGCAKPGIPDESYKEILVKGWKRYIKYHHYKNYTIEISKWVMALEDSIIKNTIIHELIHCLPYCNNHGSYFKQYAKKINEKLGYHITRVGNKKEDYSQSHLLLEEKEKYNYQVQCPKCGITFYRQRLQKNFTKKYRCARCLGKLEVVKLDK